MTATPQPFMPDGGRAAGYTRPCASALKSNGCVRGMRGERRACVSHPAHARKVPKGWLLEPLGQSEFASHTWKVEGGGRRGALTCAAPAAEPTPNPRDLAEVRLASEVWLVPSDR